MNPTSPWKRFVVGLVAAAIAVRIAVDVIRPVLPWLVALLAIGGVLLIVRWWRINRW